MENPKLKPINEVNYADIVDNSIICPTGQVVDVKKVTYDYGYYAGKFLGLSTKTVIELSKKHPEAYATCLIDDGISKKRYKLRNLKVMVY